MSFFERLPAAFIATVTFAIHHPEIIVVAVLCGAFLGAFGFVSTHFNRRR